MTRQRLPNRRPAETVELEHLGTRFTVTVGFYADGRPGEVFTHGIRTGSSLDALLADACVVVSWLIQHGVDPRDLAPSMGRLGNADMVFTDSPYNVDYAGGPGSKKKGGKDRRILNDALGDKFGSFLYDACVNILTVTKGAIYRCARPCVGCKRISATPLEGS
jgi:hypothetical protein